jgi:hypothetical protein
MPGSTIVLYTQGFSRVAGLDTSVDGAVLTATLAEPLAPGTYTVEWTALGSDGHPVQGSYQFAVSAAAGPSRSSGPVLALAAGLLAAGLVGVLVWRRRARPSQSGTVL